MFPTIRFFVFDLSHQIDKTVHDGFGVGHAACDIDIYRYVLIELIDNGMRIMIDAAIDGA